MRHWGPRSWRGAPPRHAFALVAALVIGAHAPAARARDLVCQPGGLHLMHEADVLIKITTNAI